MLKCEKCGFENPDGLDRCYACGVSLLRFAKTVQNVKFDLNDATIVEIKAPQAKRSLAYLEVKGGRFSKRVYPLHENQVIGREKCEIILRDPQISRQHAEIKFVEGDYLLIDLGSANHTFINKLTVQQPTVLQNGDMISVGNTELEFTIEKDME